METLPAVITDIGNVLVFHDNVLWLRNLRALMRRPPDADALMADIVASGVGVGRCTVAQLHARYRARFGITEPLDGFLAAWNSHFRANGRLLDTLPELARHRRLVICSNTNDAHWAWMDERFGLSAFAAACVLSFQVGCRKPDSRVYALCRKHADGAVFLDDDAANVEGACRAGLAGRVYRPGMGWDDALA